MSSGSLSRAVHGPLAVSRAAVDVAGAHVAILSNETFDATTIAVSTLLLDSAFVRLVGGRKVLASIEER